MKKLLLLVLVVVINFGAIRFLYVSDAHAASLTDASLVNKYAPSPENYKQLIINQNMDIAQAIAVEQVGTVTYERIDQPLLHVPGIWQYPELPTGCESTAAAILLQSYGYQVDKLRFADALPKAGFEVYDAWYAPHPSAAFIGNPYSYSGYGAFANVIAQTMQVFLDAGKGGHQAVAYTGLSEWDIISFLDSGKPVCVWATMYMLPVCETGGWYLIDNGVYTNQYYSFPGNEHCLVILGYDDYTVTVSDPLWGGYVTYDRSTFFSRFYDLGGQAVIINEGYFG